MTLYVDADAFLALLKSDDHLKPHAVRFFKAHSASRRVTSAMTLIEAWFVLRRYGISDSEPALNYLRTLVSEIWPVTDSLLRSAAALSKASGLGPADSVHAAAALACDAIVSSDRAFDRVEGLKRIPL